jgi:putative heme-binding domain-containing protein
MKSLWGNIRPSSAEKTRLVATYKKRLTSDSLSHADLAAGRMLFQKNCANCHKLFGDGGAIGPDITGAQRTNLDYLLENLVDPSASVAKDYQMELIATTSGRTITGLVVEQSPKALTIQTVNEKLVVPRDEIEERRASEVSMMPDGILEKLTQDEVRNLIGYVSGLKQVPLPESE